MVTAVTVTVSVDTVMLIRIESIGSCKGSYWFLQGKSLGVTGEETATFYHLSIPKRLCAYTQTTVRLYPI